MQIPNILSLFELHLLHAGEIIHYLKTATGKTGFLTLAWTWISNISPQFIWPYKFALSNCILLTGCRKAISVPHGLCALPEDCSIQEISCASLIERGIR